MKRKIQKRGPRFDKDGYEKDFDGLDIRDFKVIKNKYDFIPTPEEIARSLRNSKITIMLDDSLIKFFKKEAEKHHGSYQKMIREVLRAYYQQQQMRQRRKAA